MRYDRPGPMSIPLLLALMIACEDGSPAESAAPEDAVLTGRVLCQDGYPLADDELIVFVMVFGGGHSRTEQLGTRTDAEGRFWLPLASEVPENRRRILFFARWLRIFAAIAHEGRGIEYAPAHGDIDLVWVQHQRHVLQVRSVPSEGLQFELRNTFFEKAAFTPGRKATGAYLDLLQV